MHGHSPASQRMREIRQYRKKHETWNLLWWESSMDGDEMSIRWSLDDGEVKSGRSWSLCLIFYFILFYFHFFFILEFLELDNQADQLFFKLWAFACFTPSAVSYTVNKQYGYFSRRLCIFLFFTVGLTSVSPIQEPFIILSFSFLFSLVSSQPIYSSRNLQCDRVAMLLSLILWYRVCLMCACVIVHGVRMNPPDKKLADP